MADLPVGRVCHLTTGRLRVKIPEKRRDEAFFTNLEQRLAPWDSIEQVEVNPLTASVLVHFSDLGALFAENAMRNDLFAVDLDQLEGVDGKPRQALTEWAKQRWTDADKALRRWSGGNADIRSAAFLALVAGSILQLFRGRIAPPAATLLWDAGEVLQIWETVLEKPSGSAPQKATAEG
jgi:hypothetical protein